MADTKHGHAASPIEGDGVNYRGIVWFVVVLVGTVVVCQIFVWGLFKAMAWHVDRDEPVRSALADTIGKRGIDPQGHVVTGAAKPPAIPLNVNEPLALRAFRDSENATLDHYTWINKGAQTVALPIDRAKELLLQRGLPVRAASAAPAQPAEAAKR